MVQDLDCGYTPIDAHITVLPLLRAICTCMEGGQYILTITSSIFASNSASENGGGLHVHIKLIANNIITNSTFW